MTMRDPRSQAMVLALGLALVACRKADEIPKRIASGSARPAESAPEPPLLDPSERETLALMRIAESYRAPELLRIAESERPEHTTALLALAHAEDVELVTARLSELALDRRRVDRLEVLSVLRDVAYRRPRDRERLAPEGLATCLANLRRLAADTKDEPELRALAETIRNAYVRNGLAPPTPSAAASVSSTEPTTTAPSSRPSAD